MSKAMKDSISKMIIPLAGIALVVPFVVVGLFVGALAVAEAQSMMDNLLLVGLAASSALASALKGFGRQASKTLSWTLPAIKRSHTSRRGVAGA